MRPASVPEPGAAPWPDAVRLAGRVAAPAHDPAARLARREDDSAHYYVGRRPGATEVSVVTAATVEPLEHLGHRSRAPFDWGASSPGALELAFALLFDTARTPPPDPVCEAFVSDVVALLEPDGFVLEAGDVALWLLTAARAGFGPDDSDRRRGGLRRLVAAWLHGLRAR
ncbi:MAG: DUF6166 domain-containing protein [Solirubrobacteraceae bacterium]